MHPSDTAFTFTMPVESTGKEEQFAKLSVDDVFLELFPAWLKEKKAALLDNLRVSGAAADRELVAGELEKFDEKHEDLGLDDFIALMANRDAGKVRIVQYAYNKANPEAVGRVKLTSAEFSAALNAIVAPLGVVYGPKAPPAGDAGEKAPEPQPGQGYGSDGGAADPTPLTGYPS